METYMILTLQRWLTAPVIPVGLFSSHGGGYSHGHASRQMKTSLTQSSTTRTDVAQLRDRMESLLDDMQGHECERVRYRVKASRSAQDLWMIRSDLYQLIARQHSQSEASRRINTLLPMFEGWVPSQTLVRI
jgi:hypothetical protein